MKTYIVTYYNGQSLAATGASVVTKEKVECDQYHYNDLLTEFKKDVDGSLMVVAAFKSSNIISIILEEKPHK